MTKGRLTKTTIQRQKNQENQNVPQTSNKVEIEEMKTSMDLHAIRASRALCLFEVFNKVIDPTNHTTLPLTIFCCAFKPQTRLQAKPHGLRE